MASPVQICNVALTHLGESGLISSISPPDGSVNAGYCATFYPVAKAEMLELGNWQFATRRGTLAVTENDSGYYEYAYALPANCLRVLKVIGPEDDEAGSSVVYETRNNIIYTDTEEAVCVYTANITDSTKFSPTFVTALSFLLAAYLAGPIIKGADGVKFATAMREAAAATTDRSLTVSSNSRSVTEDYTPSSILARR